MFVDLIQAPHPLRWSIELNEWLPIHSGATGIAILSFLPEEERKRIYAQGLEELTPRTITSVDELERVVRTTKKRGYAISQGERVVGAVGMAAPIFDASGDVFGDICITIPEGRFDKKDTGRLTDALKLAAQEVSDALGRAAFIATNQAVRS